MTLLFSLLTDSRTLAQDPYQRLVRRFEMPELGIPNPAGLAFSPAANALLVVPSPGTTDLIAVTFAPDLADSTILATALVDPVNMAFDAKFNSLLFWDAGVDELVEIKTGANGFPQPSAEAMTRFNGKPFGATRAQGMTFDPGTGDLFFLVDPRPQAEPRIVRITPNTESRFGGPAAEQDGRILNVSLTSLQPSQLRGIAFNPSDGHLYIISPTEQLLHEVTQEGELLTTRDLSSFEDISSSELTNVQNIVFAPSGDQTDNPAIMNLYIADNGLKSEQGLGDLFELSLTRPEQSELRSLSIDDVATLEGDSGTVNAVFTVILSGASQQTVTVDFATQDATATAASDYVSDFGTLTFNVGDTSKQAIVQINGDVIEEGDETFLVNLSNARGFVTIADHQGTGTIIDDDPRLMNVPSDYSTVQEAFNVAAEGDTILLAPGIYHEPIEMANKSVVLASWFLKTGDSGYISQTILDGNGGSAVITIRNSAGASTTIIGLTIQNASDGISPHAKFDILNCRIIDCSDGIDYEAGSGGLCKLNLFENNSDDGIDLDNAVDIIIEENIIRNNGDDGIEIRLQPYNGPMLNYIIRNNEIHGNGEDGIQLIDYDRLSDRFFIIEGNLIHDNRMAGLGCMGGAKTKENYEGASIPERIYLFNNTFVANDYGVTGGDSLVAVNNIFVNHPGIATKNVDGGSIISYGIYWSNGADFENCNMDNPHILLSDPILHAQFQLQPTSPAIDAGTGFFIWQGETVLDRPSTSYNGMAPDLGAIEFDDGPRQQVTVSFQNGVNGYNGTRDTKLLSDSPSRNYGSDTTLEADGSPHRSTLLYWDLISIPPQSIIQSVDITVNVSNKSEDSYEFYELKHPWIEGEATWNEFSSGQSWHVAGADDFEDRGPAVLGAIADTSEGLSTISLDSTGIAVVESWVNNPASNHGFIILDYTSTNDGLIFSSRENRTISKRPKLTVTYDDSPVSTVKPLELPQEFQLSQNYPNPFNPTTKISYSIPKSGFVTLKIYDLLGKEVQTLVADFKAVGSYSLEIDAGELSSGIYFYRLQSADGFVATQKMLLLR
jgi:hypothetical protein